MIRIHIDDQTVETKGGGSILTEAGKLHIRIPTLCYHESLSPFGACRLCVVEVKQGRRWDLTTSCNTEIVQGMIVRTDSPEIRRSRKAAAELLYYKYPRTRAIRDIAERLGVRVTQTKEDARECILCGLCVRACQEIVGVNALRFEDRGPDHPGEPPRIGYLGDSCICCGACAFICPTGYIRMEPVGADRRMIWERVFEMGACRVCGKKFAPLAQLEYLSRRSDIPLAQVMTCITCREAGIPASVVDEKDWVSMHQHR
ncbi:MAG: 2Fe-2S iron-sulfur cluster-binding protein [Syntrophales bacterium]|jgi:NADH dehydrogenase/NADH:ubiquinone oxidoreductase subunit G|nr:2Fe-2S iron-sulfur cluster-binding protein [Syntrophales bacterium]